MGEHGKGRFGGKDGRMVICIVDHSYQILACVAALAQSGTDVHDATVSLQHQSWGGECQ